MILRQAELDVDPQQVEPFLTCFRAAFAVLARQPGGIWFRMLREADHPTHFICFSAWTDTESMERGRQAPDYLWVMQPRPGQPSFYRSPAVHTDYYALDMVWGLKGPDVYPGSGRTVHHITGGVGPGKWAPWRAYSRNLFSTMARQPGIASFEIYRPADGSESFLVLRGFMHKEAESVAPGGAASVVAREGARPPGAETDEAISRGRRVAIEPADLSRLELSFALDPVAKHQLYAGAAPAVTRRCDVVDMVWGMAGAQAIRQFIESRQPE